MASPTRGLAVRRRTDADLPALAEVLVAQRDAALYPVRWPLPFPVEEFIARVNDVAAWTAELDGRPVGHVAVQRADDETFTPADLSAPWVRAHGLPAERLGVIGTLFVDPGVRRLGVGRLLHDTALAWMRATGLAPCLDVVPSHAAALQMYVALGWREVERLRPHWLPADQPDVVAMVLPLS
jgi:GNAT superfamily N-acetyltransferase